MKTVNIFPVWLVNAYSHCKNLGFGVDFTPKIGSSINETPEGHILA